MRLLNPCVDPVFKALFTDNSDEARVALTAFLSAVLNRDVSNVELSQIELPEESDNERQSLFDLTCVLDEEEPVNIEMQGINIYETFDKRVEYHVAHLLNHFVKKGTEWNEIPKAYQISVLNFIYDSNHNDICTRYYMQADNGSTLSDRMNIYFIELPKVLDITDDVSELSKVEKWSKYFAYADDESKQDYIVKLAASEEGIMSAQTVLNRISTDDAMWIRQNHYYEALAREATLQGGYEKGVQRGLERGLQQGMERGLQQGMERGLQQGMEQGIIQKAKTMAKKMLLKHRPIEEIADFTELSIDDIRQLEKEEIINA